MHYLVAPCSWALFTDISASICILFTKTHSPFWTHSHLSMLQHTQHLRVYINNGRIQHFFLSSLCFLGYVYSGIQMCVEQVFRHLCKTQYMGVELPLESHTRCPFRYLAVSVVYMAKILPREWIWAKHVNRKSAI